MTEPSPETGAAPTTGTPVPGKPAKTKKPALPVWQESLLLLAIALVLAVGIKYFFVQAFYIPSESMEPLFIKNDRILVQKVSYWGDGTPQRGDIVVFKDPGGWLGADETRSAKNVVTKGLEAIGLYPSGGHLVKRVIGVGGDRVTAKAGVLKVNGHTLTEPYLPPNVTSSDQDFDVRVPDGHLWVMGDNRDNSYDSRGHIGDPGGGFVSDDLVVGKVWALIWPWKRFQKIHTPDTFKGVPSS